MSNYTRFFNRFQLLAALVMALTLSLALSSFGTLTASAASEPTHQIAGKVTAKGADTITVQLPNTNFQPTFRVTPNTVFTQSGNNHPTFADLKPGMYITATIKFLGGSEKLYVATSITLPAAPPPAPVCATSGWMYGKVEGKTPNAFYVSWSDGSKSKVAFVVNGDTKFSKSGKPVSYDAVKVGQKLEFKVKACSSAAYIATEVHLL